MGTLKTYESGGGLSLTVKLSDGKGAYVRFGNQRDGSFAFRTTDILLQSALESYPRFGTLFRIRGSETVDYELTEPEVSYSVIDSERVTEHAERVIEELAGRCEQAVSAIDAAKSSAMSEIEDALSSFDLSYDVV